MKSYAGLRNVNYEGVTAIIVNKKRVLVLKKIWIPFVIYRNLWTFPAGRLKRGEDEEEAVYREILEETQLQRSQLKPLSRYRNVVKIHINSGIKFKNTLYVFKSKSGRISLNFENSDYRWASLAEIRNEKEYTNVFANSSFILKVIRDALKK